MPSLVPKLPALVKKTLKATRDKNNFIYILER